uniref:Uncharacterized protein n=2 Tax=Corethron hystrix TaxID=216773 RepID=A0A7S1BKM8_9STRA|mmetsp:Transcript_32051/g.73729  ORF Transcript_32051/g.73729 Transcript_32051/m.73729 type:complete len:743 (+) Transcript_32051:194-2422(+)|eukprot:CAMPEP_0113307600 /NCGR_PEP_ID=MMETSP0010_2-20120614/6380_1 /TAXON_ID=216773 ORGANISM="Corethron hystrix, Strain 308" /NCGR_SAMPLE_ID=MMETSP0010_2 /ASSEMBLY_ACC=CAM_ASM_000155 /LENGTH=742 /DNA_ID=CAMNT_0000162487 /DNA_START=67 /DNA_END=2295 /DNA_ORIENTATION=- /assembly_acc=CAM_ASM_000155
MRSDFSGNNSTHYGSTENNRDAMERPFSPVADRDNIFAGRRQRSRSRLFYPGFVFLILFLSIGVSFYYFGGELGDLRSEMIAQNNVLSKQITEQQKVIKRFNSTVTNSDILKMVSKLENDLDSTKSAISIELQQSEGKIEKELSSTLAQMDVTVAQAEANISAEVSKVKREVDRYVEDTNDKFTLENSFMIYQLSGMITLIGFLISMWHMTAHLNHFEQPFIQRKVLAILFMAPLYGVTSWLSLVFSPTAGYLSLIKDCYEAYAIYTFFSFLIAVLGRGNRNVVIGMLAQRSDHLQRPLGFGCFYKEALDSPYQLASAVIFQCQIFAMQFVLLKPITATLSLILEKAHVGQEDAFSYKSPALYLMIVENVSIGLAFYGLLKFYHAIQDDIQWCRPWPKFLTIKGVVFMTFWQGLAINILYSVWDKDDQIAEANSAQNNYQSMAQNFLITIEMLIASIAHVYVFPHEEWKPGYKPVEQDDKKFGDNLAIRDFVTDFKYLLSSKRRKKAKKDNDAVEEEPKEVSERNEDSIHKKSSSDSTSIGNIESGDLDFDDDDDLELFVEALEKAGKRLDSKLNNRFSGESVHLTNHSSGTYGSQYVPEENDLALRQGEVLEKVETRESKRHGSGELSHLTDYSSGICGSQYLPHEDDLVLEQEEFVEQKTTVPREVVSNLELQEEKCQSKSHSNEELSHLTDRPSGAYGSQYLSREDNLASQQEEFVEQKITAPIEVVSNLALEEESHIV